MCNAVTHGALAGIGPNLVGVLGRNIGSVAGFNYSPAPTHSKIVWAAASLDKWITNPATFIPRNKMPFAGLTDKAKRAEIVAYLKNLK